MLQQYVLWILGALSLSVGGVAGLLAKLGIIMFQWRREIDTAINDNSVKIATAIATATSLKDDVDRHNKELVDLRTKISRIAERRFGIKDHDEDDIL